MVDAERDVARTGRTGLITGDGLHGNFSLHEHLESGVELIEHLRLRDGNIVGAEDQS